MQQTSCVGLKRKLAVEDAAGPESEPKVAAVAAVAGEFGGRCCVLRQLVLQLSLQKLCRFAPHTETGLERRVLITNTLRLVRHDELDQQGPPAQSGPPRQAPAAEGSLTPAWALEQDGEACPSRNSDSDRSQSFLAGSVSPSSPAPKDSFCWALAEIEDLYSAVTVPGDSSSFSQPERLRTPDTGSRSDALVGEMSEREPQIHTGGPLYEPLSPLDSSHHSYLCGPTAFLGNPTPFSIISSPSSASFLPDLSLDDFLFSDLDNYLCELNPCSSNLSSTPSSSPKVVSMVTDDIMEHLMEVLVGS